MRIKDMAEILGRSIKEHVERELKPVLDLIHELDERIAHAIRTPGPAGKDGRDGVDGKDGVGKDGRDGVDGKDGTSVHPDTIALMIREAADKLVANLPKPKDGQDGRDGFGLEDFQMALGADGRTVSFTFTRGELVIERAVRIPAVIYRGVFKDGDTYTRGDLVTWGGSVFHCEAESTAEKPETGSADWKLAVKRGRDGKDAKQ